VLADKDAVGIAAALIGVAHRIAVCTPVSERALPATELARAVVRAGGLEPAVYGSVAEALEGLVGEAEHGIVVTGSLVTAGEARALLRYGSSTGE
jgi:dihydrofolate synthase/folylpolyglutamate synthase